MGILSLLPGAVQGLGGLVLAAEVGDDKDLLGPLDVGGGEEIQSKTRYKVLKYLLYFLGGVFLCVLQNTPGLFVIAGVKPMLVAALAVAAAMFEGEFAGALCGAAGGEATNSTRADTPIILICSDRRTKSDEILVKLFSIGIYNALIGTDRNIDEWAANKSESSKKTQLRKDIMKLQPLRTNYPITTEATCSTARKCRNIYPEKLTKL